MNKINTIEIVDKGVDTLLFDGLSASINDNNWVYVQGNVTVMLVTSKMENISVTAQLFNKEGEALMAIYEYKKHKLFNNNYFPFYLSSQLLNITNADEVASVKLSVSYDAD